MSSTPTGRSADIQRLVTAGYSIEIRQNHLLVHDVPTSTSPGKSVVARS